MSTIYQKLNVNKPELAHSVEEFIYLGKTTSQYSYLRFCLTENRDGTPYVVHNVLDDYIEYLKKRATKVTLTSKEAMEYKYNPKKLSYKLYKSTQFYFLILKLNNMASTHDFDLTDNTVLLIPPDVLSEVISSIYKMERTAINYYKSVHSKDTVSTPIVNDRLRTTK